MKSSTHWAFPPTENYFSEPAIEGAVLELEGNHIYSRLVKAASHQVTSIATGPGGKLFLAAANPGKIFTLGPDNEPEGTFESQPFDAHIFSRWGRTEWWGENIAPGKNAGGARIEFFARSGNTSDPENNWSAWAGPVFECLGRQTRLSAGAVRAMESRAARRHRRTGSGDRLGKRRVPAEERGAGVTAIALQSPGIRVQGMAVMGQNAGQQVPVQLRMPQPAASGSSTSSAFAAAAITNLGAQGASQHFDAVPQGFSQKGYQAVLWTADDANDDQLEFAIYFRGENETTWKLLKDKLDTRFYSWDTTAMPDGAYYLKIVASDAPVQSRRRRTHRRA